MTKLTHLDNLIADVKRLITNNPTLRSDLLRELGDLRKKEEVATTDHGELWPNEPCGRSLEQCPYNKAEHIQYFQSRGDKPDPLKFR